MRSKRSPLTSVLDSESDLTELGQRLAPALSAGDVLLLDGPIGAGKTHLSRAIIQARLVTPEDVPSPTYTLVQTYQAEDVEIWHADLYRLSDASELAELGLESAFASAIVLIEWPDRLPIGFAPETAVRFSFRILPEGREVTIEDAPKHWRLET